MFHMEAGFYLAYNTVTYFNEAVGTSAVLNNYVQHILYVG